MHTMYLSCCCVTHTLSEYQLVRKYMNVNEHKRLFNITFRHKFKSRNSTFIAILHFTVKSHTGSCFHWFHFQKYIFFVLWIQMAVGDIKLNLKKIISINCHFVSNSLTNSQKHSAFQFKNISVFTNKLQI